METQYLVPAAIFEKDGKVLLVDKTEMVSGLKGWEIPGGRAKFGLSFEDALKQKMKDYFGVEIKINKMLPLIHSNISVDGTMQFWVVPAICTFLSEKFTLAPKIKEVKWFSFEEIKQMENNKQLVPGDMKLLREYFSSI